MKKIVYIVLLILSFTFNLYSQNNLKNILSELTVNGWLKRIDIRKINRQKYVLRKNIFQNIKKGKVVDIFYNKNKKSEFCLYYLNSFKEFDIYILSDITDIQMPINTIAYGGKNNFILFDINLATIYS